jgi:hypothetical protein
MIHERKQVLSKHLVPRKHNIPMLNARKHMQGMDTRGDVSS